MIQTGGRFGEAHRAGETAARTDEELRLRGRNVDADLHVLGGRVREFSLDGELLGTWGFGTPDSGVSQASHPAIDAAGHLWVIDVDPATRHSFIKVLEPA